MILALDNSTSTPQKTLTNLLESIKKFQVDHLAISANNHIDRYAALGYPVLVDRTQEFTGPLAGIETAMQYFKAGLLMVTTCDMPGLPSDLVKKMHQQLHDEQWRKD